MRKREGDKHNDLIQAGLRIFARKGFDQAKITEIAAEAKVATGTFYLYFPGKDELLIAIFDLIWNELHEKLVKFDQADPVVLLSSTLREMMLFLLESPNRAQVYLGEYARILREYPEGLESAQRCLGVGAEAMQQAIKDGIFYNNPPTLGKATMFGAVRGVLEYFLRVGKYTEAEIDQSVELIIRQLRKN